MLQDIFMLFAAEDATKTRWPLVRDRLLLRMAVVVAISRQMGQTWKNHNFLMLQDSFSLFAAEDASKTGLPLAREQLRKTKSNTPSKNF